MKSSFFELNVAMSGIHSSRAQLNTVFHNMANEGTPGYSRQYAMQKAGIALPNGSRGMVGTGSLVYGVDQHRDVYLDTKYCYQNGKYGAYTAKYAQASLMETHFGVFETGVGTRISTFFSAVKSMVSTIPSYSEKQVFTESTQSLIDYFNSTADALTKQQKDINEEVKIIVDRINTLGKQIQSLNEQITRQEMTGNKANDLRDQRALLVDELSGYVNVTTAERTNDNGIKEYYVYVNNYAFVSHYQLNEMECVIRDEKLNPEDAEGLYDVVWKHSGKNIVDANLTGELKGLIEVRDGNNGNYFEGYITSVDNTTNPGYLIIEMAGFNRDDMLETGFITIKGKEYHYTDMVYDHSTNPPTVTLVIEDGAGVNVTAGDTGTIAKTTDYQGIPYYMNMLNEFCRTLAIAFNEGTNRNGEDLGITGHYNCYTPDGSTNIYYFNYDGNDSNNTLDYSKITASNFSLSKEILDDLGNLAVYIDPNNPGESDNNAFLEFADLEGMRGMFKQGTFHDYMNAVTTTLGVNNRELETGAKLQADLVSSVQSQRLSVSGVNRDEEAANMIMYQMIYNTCSRIIQTIDQLYTTLINLGA